MTTLDEVITAYRATGPRWYLAALALGADAEPDDGDGILGVTFADRRLSTDTHTPGGLWLSRREADMRFGGRRYLDGSESPAWMRALAWLVTGDDRDLADPRPPHLTHPGE